VSVDELVDEKVDEKAGEKAGQKVCVSAVELVDGKDGS